MGNTQNYPFLGTAILVNGVPATSLDMATTTEMASSFNPSLLVSPIIVREWVDDVNMAKIVKYQFNAAGDCIPVSYDEPAKTIVVGGDISTNLSQGSSIDTNAPGFATLTVDSFSVVGPNTSIIFYEDITGIQAAGLSSLVYGRHTTFVIPSDMDLKNGYISEIKNGSGEKELARTIMVTDHQLDVYFDYPAPGVIELSVSSKFVIPVPPSTACDIIQWDFPGSDIMTAGIGVSDVYSSLLTWAYNNSLNNLTPLISISPGATVSPLSGVAHDFSINPVIYVVTAEDGITTKSYTIHCSDSGM